ncbi:MAG: hypothetical protein AB7P49_20320 [Bdellovibrionales bacterium]
MGIAAAQAQAFCGPYFTEYRVATSGAGNFGIRCVQIGANSMIWYGEGAWSGVNYRHIGRAARGEFGLAGWARDIHGNGEVFHNKADGIMPIYEGTWTNGAPQRIRMTQTWNETWVKANANTPQYYSNLGSLENCGRHLKRYRVGPYDNGTGIRCVMPGNGAAPLLFVGEGYWGGTRYMHLGAGSSKNRAHASDICRPGYGFCNTFGYDSLIFSAPSADQLRVTGAWNEEWNAM